MSPRIPNNVRLLTEHPEFKQQLTALTLDDLRGHLVLQSNLLGPKLAEVAADPVSAPANDAALRGLLTTLQVLIELGRRSNDEGDAA